MRSFTGTDIAEITNTADFPVSKNVAPLICIQSLDEYANLKTSSSAVHRYPLSGFVREVVKSAEIDPYGKRQLVQSMGEPARSEMQTVEAVGGKKTGDNKSCKDVSFQQCDVHRNLKNISAVHSLAAQKRIFVAWCMKENLRRGCVSAYLGYVRTKRATI